MGIFDVFSNSKSSAQGDDSQNTQASTTMSDVQYPIPDANASQPVIQQSEQDVSDQFSQFASNYNPKNDPLDLTTFDNAVQGNTSTDLNAVAEKIEPTSEAVNQTALSAVDTPIPGNPFTSAALTQSEPQNILPATDLPLDQNVNPQEASNALEAAMQNLQTPETNQNQSATVQTADASVPVPNNYDYSTLVADEPQTPIQPEVQTQPAEQVLTPAPETPVQEEPQVEVKPEVPTIEFGVSPSTAPQAQEPQGETPLTPEFKAEEPVATNAAPETNEVEEGKQFENPDGTFGDITTESEQNSDTMSVEVAKEFENPDGSFGDVQAEPQPEPEIQTPQPEVQPQKTVAPLSVTNNYQPEDTSMIGKINLQNIKKLGFIGLNAKSLNEGIKMDLQELSEAIGGMLDEYILDSSIGYTPELLRGLSNKELNIKSFQLKSAYSLFTQEPFNLTDYSNLTSYIFSDSLERLKSIIGSSDALVLVYSEGMNNLMAAFAVMNMADFYKEIGKPFVLLGNEWESLLNTLVTNKVLDQSVVSSILIASDSNELLSHLQTLDNNFKKASTVDSKSKIVDLRKEDDELIYLK